MRIYVISPAGVAVWAPGETGIRSRMHRGNCTVRPGSYPFVWYTCKILRLEGASVDHGSRHFGRRSVSTSRDFLLATSFAEAAMLMNHRNSLYCRLHARFRVFRDLKVPSISTASSVFTKSLLHITFAVPSTYVDLIAGNAMPTTPALCIRQ